MSLAHASGWCNIVHGHIEGSGYLDSGKAIAVDGDGNRYVQGSFSGTMDADPGLGTHTLEVLDVLQ